MKSDEILDHEPNNELPPFRHRPAAIITESIMVLPALIGILTSNISLIIIGMCSLSFAYMPIAWFLFKADRFRVGDVLFATLSGMGIGVGLLGILFQIMAWQDREEMLLSSSSIVGFVLLCNIIWYLVRRKNPFELRFSLKIMLRLAILLVFLLVYLL